MNKRTNLLALALLICWSFASSAEEDLQARFEKSLTDLKSLGNVDIEFLDTYWSPHSPNNPNAPFSRTFQYSYIASGLKDRATCKLISGTETNLAKEFVSAFDGEMYATYDNQRYLTKGRNAQSSDRGQSPLNPLIAPFLFLTTHSDNCLPCILQHTYLISQNFTNELVLPKEQKSDGLIQISLPGLNLGQKPTTWEIAIDEAGSSFAPRTIRMVAPGVGIEVINNLLDYTNLGAYRFPTRIEWTMNSFASTKTLISTGTVTLLSARVPDQIADSVFKLDNEEKSAAVIWDWKVRKLTKMAPELAKAQATHGNVRTALLIIMATTIAAVVLIAKRLTARSAGNQSP